MATEQDAWKKLLTVSTGLSDGGDPPPAEVNPDNLDFLQKAMHSTFGDHQGPSVIQRFLHYGSQEPMKLKENPAMLAAAKELADQLDDYLLMGNFAEQFVSEDGLTALTNLSIRNDDQDLSLLYLRLVQPLAENRTEFQEVIIKSDVFVEYINALERHRESKPILVGALISAISSIVRSHEPAFKRFVELKGLEHTLDIVKSSKDDRNCAKAARMLASFNFTFSPDKNNTTVVAEELKNLRNHLALAYALLKRRIEHMKVEEVHKESVEFVEETFEEIKKQVHQFDKDELTEETEKTLAEYQRR